MAKTKKSITKNTSPHQQKHYIFTLTTGRSGTASLATILQQNLSDALVHHEFIGFDDWGVNTPLVSHLTQFNNYGNISPIRQFWQQKLHRISQTQNQYYAETSHLLMKAGLVENLQQLYAHGQVHLVLLQRDIYQLAMSFRRRFAFLNRGSIWMWYLDPRYAKNIVNSQPFFQNLDDVNASCLWYICEIITRSHYYQIMFNNTPQITFHRLQLDDLNHNQKLSDFFARLDHPIPPSQIKLSPPQNTYPHGLRLSNTELNSIKKFIENLDFDPYQIALNYIQNGQSLA